MPKYFTKTIQYCRAERIHIAVIIILRLLLLLISVVQPLLYANMITGLLNKQFRVLVFYIAFLIVSYLLSQAFH